MRWCAASRWDDAGPNVIIWSDVSAENLRVKVCKLGGKNDVVQVHVISHQFFGEPAAPFVRRGVIDGAFGIQEAFYLQGIEKTGANLLDV